MSSRSVDISPRSASFDIGNDPFADIKHFSGFSNAVVSNKSLHLGGNLNVDDGSVSSSSVFCIRHWFQMLRIHASRVSAQVVKNQSFRDRADEKFVNVAVRCDVFAPQVCRSIPKRIGLTIPFPATCTCFNPRPNNRVVPRNISNWLAFNPTLRSLALWGDSGFSSASAKAFPGGIRRFHRLLGKMGSCVIFMEKYESLWLSSDFSMRCSREFRNWRAPQTSAHAQTSRVRSGIVGVVATKFANRNSAGSAHARFGLTAYWSLVTSWANSGRIRWHFLNLLRRDLAVSRPRWYQPRGVISLSQLYSISSYPWAFSRLEAA